MFPCLCLWICSEYLAGVPLLCSLYICWVAQTPGAQIMERPPPSSWSCCQNSCMWVLHMFLLLVQVMKFVYRKCPLTSTRRDLHSLTLISHLTSFLRGHRPPRLQRREFRSHPSARGVPSSLLDYKENHGMRKYQYLNDFKNRLFKWSFMQ